ncbi:helix-turn-helix transcriptional regulator [Roseateles sp.]|uniref:helix-turn-helix transcriptional regulator n=1 Tax=Roseateles sp. TaxID=1971397 RepID=UPI00391CF8BE
MLEMIAPSPPPRGPGPQARPERRSAASLSSHWLGLVLEELDYGVLLLNQRGEVLYSNRAARQAMNQGHPLLLQGHLVRTRSLKDGKPLFDALAQAEGEGRRCLLRLGEGDEQANVVVVPLNRDVEQAAVLLVLERRQLCGALAVQWFALRYGLTPAETEVLKALSDGHEPASVAQQQGVAISTVRTQIQSIRAKSGTPSIRELLRQLAVLPPLMSALYN